MALSQEYKSKVNDFPDFPGILMIEPSKIPFYQFDCEIMGDFEFIKRGEKIKIDILPVELGNKLILCDEHNYNERIEIKISLIKNIEISKEEGELMNLKKSLLQIILKNDSKIVLYFDDYKIHEFIGLVNDFSKINENYWNFCELEFQVNNSFQTTKIFYKTPFLAKGEELLWSYIGTEGVLNKKLSFLIALTNFRAIIYFFDSHESEVVFLSSIDEISVLNSRRIFYSSGLENFFPRGLADLKISLNEKKRGKQSQTMGDIVFIKNGEKIIKFGQMMNPKGLADFAKSIKNNVIIQNMKN